MFTVNYKHLVELANAEVVVPVLPKQYEYSPRSRDLRNVTPTDMLYDNEGNRLIGRFSPTDVTIGSPSPVIWAFWPAMQVLGFLAILGMLVASVVGVWLPASMAVVEFKAAMSGGSSSSTAMRVVMMLPSLLALLAGYMAIRKLLPEGLAKMAGKGLLILAVVLVGLVAYPKTGVVVVAAYWASATIAALSMLPMLLLAWFAYVVVAEGDPGRPTFTVLATLLAALCAVVAFVPVIGPVAGAIASAWMMLLPWTLIRGYDAARQRTMEQASIKSQDLDAVNDAKAHEAARAKQVAVANRTPDDLLFPIGVGKGILRSKGDPLTPDAGKPIAIGLEEVAKHVVVFGRSGTGKTRLARRSLAWLVSIARAKNGKMFRAPKGTKVPRKQRLAGVVVIDGKGSDLPREMFKSGLLDYCIDPRSPNLRINIVAGLKAGVFGQVFKDVFGSAQPNGEPWAPRAADYLDAAKTLIIFMAAKGVAGVRDDMATISRFCFNDAWRIEALKVFAEQYPDEIRATLSLSESFDDWAVGYPGLPNETRGSVSFTLSSWIKSIVNHPELSDLLSHGDSDGDYVCVDILEDICVRGAHVGIALSAKDGQAGVLALKLVSAALQERIFERAGRDWRAAGEFPVVHMIDEASVILTSKHADIAAQGRSLGAWLWLMLQNAQQITKALGDQAAATSMLDNVSTVVTFRSAETEQQGHMTTYEYVSSVSGTRNRLLRDDVNVYAAPLAAGVAQERASGILNRSSGSILDLLGSVSSMLAEVRRKFGLDPQSQDDEKDRLAQVQGGEYKSQLTACVRHKELALYIAAEGDAFVLTNRAGTLRREFCDLSADAEKAMEDWDKLDPDEVRAKTPWLLLPASRVTKARALPTPATVNTQHRLMDASRCCIL